jgi:ribosomal protein L7/L12
MDPWVMVIPIVGIPVILILLTESASATKRQRETAARLARVERKLQLILDHLRIVEPEPILPEVVNHLENGKKILAIKAYRQATGESLIEAKEAVERMAQERGL